MGRLFLVAFRNLVQHRRRTLLLGSAIAGVTLLLVLVLGLTHAVTETMMRSASSMTGHVNVAGFYKVTSSMAAPVVTDFAQVREVVKRGLPEVRLMVDRGRGFARIISDTSSMQLSISGVDINQETGMQEVLRLSSGDLGGLRERNAVVLFEEQARKLEVKVGDGLTLSAPTPRGVNNTLDATVVAIAKNLGLVSGFNVFMNHEGLRQLYQMRPETTGALQLYLEDAAASSTVKEQARAVLEAAGYTVMPDDPRPFFAKFERVNSEAWTGQRLDVTTWEDETSFFSWTVQVVKGLCFILIFVLIAIISVGVMNALWIAIRERTREIGTLRAIGMQRSRVLTMFVAEGFLLGLTSTSAGAGLGLLCAAFINAAGQPVPEALQLFLMADTVTLQVTPRAVALAICLITGCTTFISLFPSFLAARLKPVTAMHHVG